jgi:hypothetical protein
MARPLNNKRTGFQRYDKIASVKAGVVMLCKAHVDMQWRPERAIGRECGWLLVKAGNPLTTNRIVGELCCTVEMAYRKHDMMAELGTNSQAWPL